MFRRSILWPAILTFDLFDLQMGRPMPFTILHVTRVTFLPIQGFSVLGLGAHRHGKDATDSGQFFFTYKLV